jgi:hypothetical protein
MECHFLISRTLTCGESGTHYGKFRTLFVIDNVNRHLTMFTYCVSTYEGITKCNETGNRKKKLNTGIKITEAGYKLSQKKGIPSKAHNKKD